MSITKTQESKLCSQARPFMSWCGCIRIGLHCDSLWSVSATSPTLIHYSQVACWSSCNVTGFPTPLLVSVAHLNLFLPSQCANTLGVLIASYSHIWYSFPLLQKAGLFIYLLKRCQQQRATGPWNRSTAAWRSHGEQARSLAAIHFFPLESWNLFFLFFLSIGRLIPLHAKWKLHFNCLFGSFSSSTFVLSQLSNCPFLDSFPLCLSRNKGWTCGCSIRPLQLTWARNINFNSSARHFPIISALWKASPEDICQPYLYLKCLIRTKNLPEDTAPS